MNYLEFKNKVVHWPIIPGKDVMLLDENKQLTRNQLNRWQKRGLIVKLKRGVYLLNKNDRKLDPSRGFIANQLYRPSYLSLEYALNFYGFIPERVVDVTSVTTKKTTRLTNALGRFIYQHIKPEVFRGFRMIRDEAGLNYFIAEPEKAIVDFLYLNLLGSRAQELLEVSFRFQNLAALKQKRILELAKLYRNSKLLRICQAFCELIEKEKKL